MENKIKQQVKRMRMNEHCVFALNNYISEYLKSRDSSVSIALGYARRSGF
jgi:hypothetical protein